MTLGLIVAAPLAAQDLEPRAFAPAPVGFNIAAISLSHSSGDLVFDASLPIKDVTGKTDGLALGYQRFFGLFGQTAKFAVAAAGVDASAQGFVNNLYHERKFRGPVDPRVAVSFIFHGAPAMTPVQYSKYKPHTLAGFALSLAPPLGQYDHTKLLNAGTNRWTLRSQLGASRYQGKWTFEGTLGGQFFTDNHEFFGEATQSQSAIYSVQGHVSYSFRQQLWVAASATFYRGGSTTIDGIESPGFTSNSRYGVSGSMPFGKRQSISMNYSRGLSTRFGSNYDTIIVTWIVRWL
jgi:hypothetical protein